ncbi:RING finger protein 17 [Pholidichthys leucotaenia]
MVWDEVMKNGTDTKASTARSLEESCPEGEQLDSPPALVQPEPEPPERELEHAESPEVQQLGANTAHNAAQQSFSDGREEEPDYFHTLAQQAMEVTTELTGEESASMSETEEALDTFGTHDMPQLMMETTGEGSATNTVTTEPPQHDGGPKPNKRAEPPGAQQRIKPKNEAVGNLPRVLLCGHVYCTICLISIQCSNTITCPECEVESSLSDDGVCGLLEESRIIGLIYTAKMNRKRSCRDEKPKSFSRNKPHEKGNATTVDIKPAVDIEKIEKAVDKALAQAAQNLAQLQHIHEELTTGLMEQVRRERAWLEMEIKNATDKALHAIYKWKDQQLSDLTKLQTQFSSTNAALSHIQGRIKALETAMQIAREVQRVPFLARYCVLDKVLETLQAPLDNQSFDTECITMGAGISCLFQSECLNQNLTLFLKMEVTETKHSSESQPQKNQPISFTRKSSRKSAPSSKKLPVTHKRDQESPPSGTRSSRGSSSSPRGRLNASHQSLASDVQDPEVIIEEFFDEQEQAVPPTGPELASDRRRIGRKRRHQFFSNKRSVNQWVVVTHIVNPNHFYIRYVAEKRESESLSKAINTLCRGDCSSFTSGDTIETGLLIFVKLENGLWCRARVVEVLQIGYENAVKACPVTQLASVKVFFLDLGMTKCITIQSEELTSESLLLTLKKHMRKIEETNKREIVRIVPQAIRCSLKDLVPYDVAKGWSEEARTEFSSVVGSAAVEMRIFGQERDSLLVDLKKIPMDQATDAPISICQHLVYNDVARFYSPVTLASKPLQYYSPVYPKINTELNAVVSHINSPADFYIQLVDNMESFLLSAKLQDVYNAASVLAEDELSIYCPASGQACVALFEGLWYRAQIIGLHGGRKVEVQYVDFGNKEVLSVYDLRKIKDEFLALPAMAIHCCLSDVIPVSEETWSDACTKKFITIAHQKLVIIIATGVVSKHDPMPVQLLMGDLDGLQTNIAELLVKEELAFFKNGLSRTKTQVRAELKIKAKKAAGPDGISLRLLMSCADKLCGIVEPVFNLSVKLKSKSPSHSGDDSAIWDDPLEMGAATEGSGVTDQMESVEENYKNLDCQPHLKLHAKLKDLKVRVCHVNSPSCFYVQLTQYDSQLKRVCEQLKKEFALTEPQDVMWKANMYCAVHVNGVWERGKICSDVTSNNIAELRRCDHGNIVKLHVGNLRLLPSALVGSLALECTLYDIRPTGGRSTWTKTACDQFSYYLTGASAIMTIKELTDERPVPVTLFCSNRTGEFISISDFLANEGLALRERKPRNAAVEEPKDTDAGSLEDGIQTVVEKKSPCPSVSIIPFVMPSSVVSAHNPPKPTPRCIITPEKVKTALYQPPELPCLGHIKIHISAIGEDGVIYVRTQNAEYQLEQLRERIQQSMKSWPQQKPYTWKSVLGCAVIGPDMLWYRGQLKEVLGGHVEVQYVDYGQVENIPVVHVYPMLLCDNVPQLCIPCQLLGINPVGNKWQQEAVKLLKELLMNRHVDMQVVELPTDPRGPLIVELFLDGLNINRILCHYEHAAMDHLISAKNELPAVLPAPVLDQWDINTEGLEFSEEPPLGSFLFSNLPQVGESLEVRVKHVLTPNELFLWPLEGTADVQVNGECLDEALARIKPNCLPQLTSFPQGGPCLAEYIDGKYYRAKLMKITSLEPVTILVQHVDFGSYDTLPIKKLRQMPPELMHFPCRALKVKVAGFKPPQVNIEEDVLPYCPEWSTKATMVMIHLLHAKITATVVAREPEFTVQLYNHNGDLVHVPLVKSGLAEFE